MPGYNSHEAGFAKLPDGGEIAYQVHGREHGDPPVLLIRPLGGSMELWGAFLTVLSQKLRVVSFDFCGTGQSSAGPAWISTRGLARDSLRVLDHLGVERAHVFGVSLGGMTATWLAILAPARVAKLCIASAPARGLSLTHAGVARSLGLASCFVRAQGGVESALVKHILSRSFVEAHPDEVRRIERILRAEPVSRAALLKHALAGVLHDARHHLRQIEAPTLVLAGDHDTLLGVEPPRALANAIARARFEIIAASGHALTLEQPVATATCVSQFFLSPPPAGEG